MRHTWPWDTTKHQLINLSWCSWNQFWNKTRKEAFKLGLSHWHDSELNLRIDLYMSAVRYACPQSFFPGSKLDAAKAKINFAETGLLWTRANALFYVHLESQKQLLVPCYWGNSYQWYYYYFSQPFVVTSTWDRKSHCDAIITGEESRNMELYAWTVVLARWYLEWLYFYISVLL